MKMERRAFMVGLASLAAAGIVKAKGKRFIESTPEEAMEYLKAAEVLDTSDAQPSGAVLTETRVWLDDHEFTDALRHIHINQPQENVTQFGDSWESFVPVGPPEVTLELLREGTVEMEGVYDLDVKIADVEKMVLRFQMGPWHYEGDVYLMERTLSAGPGILVNDTMRFSAAGLTRKET